MATKMNGLSHNLLIHPGETIKELIEEQGMSQEELAKRTTLSTKHISKIINGKMKISAMFAKKLEYVFNIPAKFWMNLQLIYDNEEIEIKEKNDIKEAEYLILKELKKVTDYCIENKIISASENKSSQVLEMRKFLRVSTLDSLSSLSLTKQVAFRVQTQKIINVNILHAWQRLCEYYTENEEPENIFSVEKLKKEIDNIKATMFLEVNDMRIKLKEIFSKCGVIFEIIPHFTGAPVQGYLANKNDKIILCMTLRQSFADIFWFTLFHEIGHLVNDDLKGLFIDFIEYSTDKKEKNADIFAKNALINELDYINFIEKMPLTLENINLFAKKQKVKPYIVIGRIQKEKDDYSFLAKHKVQYKWS